MKRRNAPGPGVDATGQPAVDPTKNVLDKVDSEVRRIDDMAALRDEHQRDLAEVRDNYAERIRIAESARIDANRAFDQAARDRAAEVATEQAQTLVKQVASVAEAARASQDNATTAARAELSNALAPIQLDVEGLKQARYTNAGGAAQVVEARTTTNARSGSWGLWVGVAVAVVMGAGGLLLTAITTVLAVIAYIAL